MRMVRLRTAITRMEGTRRTSPIKSAKPMDRTLATVRTRITAGTPGTTNTLVTAWQCSGASS
jgi:hypothetical protein